MNNKAFATNSVILLALAIILAGVGGYLAFGWKAPAGQPQGMQSVVTSTVSQVDTSGWKTYINSQYGFEFRYPSQWSVSDTAKGADFSYLGRKIAVLGCPIREVGYEAWDVKSETREIKVSGKNYPIELWNLKDKDRNAASDFSIILVNRTDFQKSCEINITAGGNYDPVIAYNIYSTFKFISSPNNGEGQVSPSSGTDTSGWKTYRNEQFGFEFRYPSDFKVETDNTAPAYDTNYYGLLQAVRVEPPYVSYDDIKFTVRKNTVVNPDPTICTTTKEKIGEALIIATKAFCADAGFSSETYKLSLSRDIVLDIMISSQERPNAKKVPAEQLQGILNSFKFISPNPGN